MEIMQPEDKKYCSNCGTWIEKPSPHSWRADYAFYISDKCPKCRSPLALAAPKTERSRTKRTPFLQRVFASRRKQSFAIPYNEATIKIKRLPSLGDNIMHRLLSLHITQDPIDLLNLSLQARCPVCGLDYRTVGFDIYFLSALVGGKKMDIPTVLSDSQGMYSRSNRGICPNPNCSSETVVVQWKGMDLS